MDERELVKWLITQESWKQYSYETALFHWRNQTPQYKKEVEGQYQNSISKKSISVSEQGVTQRSTGEEPTASREESVHTKGGGQYPSQWAAIGYGHTVDGQPFQVLSHTLPSSNLYTPEISAYIYQNLWGKNLITGEEFLLKQADKDEIGLNYASVYQASMKASAYNQITAQNMQLTPEMKKELDRQLQQLPPGSAFDVEGAFNQLSRPPSRQAQPGRINISQGSPKRDLGELVNRAERLARF